jgi:thiamine-phosphate pyrophosphorylase
MKFEFTPAAQRALLAAARWRLTAAETYDRAEALSPQAVLLGLLDEPECRAAIWLASCAIDVRAVRERWPALARVPAAPATWPVRFSAELELALSATEARLTDYPRPLVLATEHLLLALAHCSDEAGLWLRERGLSPDRLEAQIHALYGISSEPLAAPESMLDPSRSRTHIAAPGPCQADDRHCSAPHAAEPGLPHAAAAQPASATAQCLTASSPPHTVAAQPTVPTTECDAAKSPPLTAPVPRVADLSPTPAPTDQPAWTTRQRPDAGVPESATSRPSGVTPMTSKAQPHPHVEIRMETARILDAAANRAREALRVIEDYARFVLDDRHLTACVKDARHALARLLLHLPEPLRLAARDTPGDVGASLDTDAERSRRDLNAVLQANCKRLQEALRSLEEFGKLVSDELAQGCKQLRYHSYTLERALFTTYHAGLRLASTRLYVLIDGRATAEEFATLVSCLVEAGVHALQLRDKRLSDRALAARAQALRALTRGSSTLCIINDRADLASLSQADGVHVGQDELAVEAARRLVGPATLVGLSTHSLEQAREGVLLSADYLGVGPVFPTATKAFEHYPGLELVRAVAGEIRLPWFAIGGIGPANIERVLEAGATRVAVSSAVCGAADPAAAARSLLERLR